MLNSRNTLSLLVIFINAILFAQKISVYKTNDLLKRIYNKSDTTYVVNFWATWCKPCVAELPDVEKINLESRNTKTKVILVTLDFKEDVNKRVKPFLKKSNILSEVILLDEINGNDFINQIAEQWTGAIPATIITQNNKQRFEFYEKKVSYEFLKEKLIQ